jgi:hypothetical protein
MNEFFPSQESMFFLDTKRKRSEYCVFREKSTPKYPQTREIKCNTETNGPPFLTPNPIYCSLIFVETRFSCPPHPVVLQNYSENIAPPFSGPKIQPLLQNDFWDCVPAVAGKVFPGYSRSEAFTM